MNDTFQKFFEEGRKLRQKRRKGVFVAIEKDIVVLDIIKKWIGPASSLLTFNCPVAAVSFFRKHKPELRCVIVNMDNGGLCDTENVIKYLNSEMPEVVTISYTKSSEEAKYLTTHYPRITTIYNSDGVRGLIESLDVELVEVV